MDSEAAVIRSEMSRTRADLDRKLTQLESRAREMTPQAYVRRHLSDNAWDRALGGTLLAIGSWMAWKRYRRT